MHACHTMEHGCKMARMQGHTHGSDICTRFTGAGHLKVHTTHTQPHSVNTQPCVVTQVREYNALIKKLRPSCWKAISQQIATGKYSALSVSLTAAPFADIRQVNIS